MPCWSSKTNLSASGDAGGSINTSPIPAADSDGLGAHSARTFGEAQVKLSALLGSSGCTAIGSAYLKSRSSDSFTAALKDFVPPAAVNITNCGTVDIQKNDDDGSPLAGAVFTLYTDNAPLGGSPPHGGEDTATSFTCTTGSDGKCSMANVPFGQYWVVESTTPTGYTTAADQNVIISSGSPTVSLTFVDPQTHRAIVLVCHEGTNKLYSVQVNGGTDKASIGSVPTALANKGVTEADLCGIGGASFGGLPHGDKTLTAKIAAHP